MPKNMEVPQKQKGAKKKAIAISIAGVLAAGGVVGAVYYKQNSESKFPSEIKKAQSATAELGSISNTIVGTGTLTLSDAQSQTIPSGLEIEEVLIESGDKVAKGDTIATVSKSSVLKAVEETQEDIRELDDQISNCQEEDATNSINASVDGKVKLIYAKTGDDITDVMLENGSILVLSLDGKMAVDIKAPELKEDDAVTVTLSSGTQVAGTVESTTDSICTVTLTDDGTEYDDKVTVTDSEGNELGTGKLYIHKPLEVTGTTGTVSTVNVTENENVSSGTELITLESNTNNVQYEQLLAERDVYSATLKKLLQLSKNQNITANISGTVQSVNISAGSSDSSSSNSSAGSSDTSGVSKMSYTTFSHANTVSKENITDESYVSVAGSNASYNNVTLSDSQAGIIRLSSTNIPAMTGAENNEEMEIAFAAEADADKTVDENNSNPATALTLRIMTEGQNTAATLAIAAPVTGNTPTGEVTTVDGSYTGNINWNLSDSSFQAGAVYQANVTLYAGQGFVFTGSSISEIDTGIISGVTVSEDGSTISFTITYPQTSENSNSENDTENSSENNKNSNDSDDNSGEFSDTDKSQNGNNTDSTGRTGDSSVNNSQPDTSENQNNTAKTDDSMSSNASSQSGSGTRTAGVKSDVSSDTSESSDITNLISTYNTEVEAFTISSDEDMFLEVSVDELDINSVELGQKATVELDAIEAETFTGEVTAIGDTASASGGVAKYTVSLTIPKDNRMKQGMNASATITIDSRENVVTIPVNALQEEGSKVFVYTEQDDAGNLSGEKEVTTGLSNGTTVEITEGLQEGETVYYNKTGNTQNNTSGSEEFLNKNFDRGTAAPGGNIPSDKNETRGGNGSQGGRNGQSGPGNKPDM